MDGPERYASTGMTPRSPTCRHWIAANCLRTTSYQPDAPHLATIHHGGDPDDSRREPVDGSQQSIGPGGCLGAGVPVMKAPRLHAIAANFHVTPAARMIAAGVEKQPPASCAVAFANSIHVVRSEEFDRGLCQ
jgi:hypothetical protein